MTRRREALHRAREDGLPRAHVEAAPPGVGRSGRSTDSTSEAPCSSAYARRPRSASVMTSASACTSVHGPVRVRVTCSGAA
ncbi:MAG: hypothetical protein U0326_22065 [Polyangiales bacterium]